MCKNVRRYHHIEKDIGYYNLALELAEGTLDDFVEGNYRGPDISENSILAQATEGLKWMHSDELKLSKLSLLQATYAEKMLEKKYDITQNSLSSSSPMNARALPPSPSLSSDPVVVGAV